MNNNQNLIEVIRCGDCRHYEPSYYDKDFKIFVHPFCYRYDAHFDEPPFYFGEEQHYSPYDYFDNGFCAWGERKLSDSEIDEIYNSNVSEDIEDIVEYGIMSKEDIAYTIIRQKQMD